ncbi:hypothetical protein EJ05DRAFT_525738, partial [Pseudovirgaria hyperparasitica]
YGIQHLASSIQHPASSIQHPASSIQHPQHPTSMIMMLLLLLLPPPLLLLRPGSMLIAHSGTAFAPFLRRGRWVVLHDIAYDRVRHVCVCVCMCPSAQDTFIVTLARQFPVLCVGAGMGEDEDEDDNAASHTLLHTTSTTRAVPGKDRSLGAETPNNNRKFQLLDPAIPPLYLPPVCRVSG